jgi:hypothetical protein
MVKLDLGTDSGCELRTGLMKPICQRLANGSGGITENNLMQKQIAVTNTLSCSTSPAAVRPISLTAAPFPFRKKACSSRAAPLMPNDRRPFRLRFRDGRSAPAPFPPVLHPRLTFPFAEPQAEALN